MPLNPIAHHRGKLADLQIETAVIPRRKTKCIFFEAHLRAARARVEPAIQPRLRKEINLRSGLGVEKECQARIEEVVDLAVDEARRRLLKMVRFKVNCAAQSSAKNVVKRRESKCRIEPLKKIISVKPAYCAGEQTNAERRQYLHVF